MGNQDSKANNSDSDSEKTEQYTHHIKVFEQVSKPMSSESDSGDDAYHSASDPERAEVSRLDESESDHGSISFSDEESNNSEQEAEEGGTSNSVPSPKHRVQDSEVGTLTSLPEPSCGVGSSAQEKEVAERNISVGGEIPDEYSPKGDQFLKRQVKPVLGFVDSSDSDMESEEEILMEIDKCLENASGSSAVGVPKTSENMMNPSTRSQFTTSSPTSRMLDMVSVETSDTQSQFAVTGASAKRKISDVEPEVITNADVRGSGGANRPFKGNAGIPQEQGVQKQMRTMESKCREGHKSPKHFKHFTNSPFRTNPLLTPTARHVGHSEEEKKGTAESVKTTTRMTVPKTSLVASVLDAKEKANSQQPSLLKNERKNDQQQVIYTQKQTQFPRYLFKSRSDEECPGTELPTQKHSIHTTSTSEHNDMNQTSLQSGYSQDLNEMETGTVTVSQPRDIKCTSSPQRNTVQFGSGPTFSPNINSGGTTATQSVSVSPSVSSSPAEDKGSKNVSVFGSSQPLSALRSERVNPTEESVQAGFESASLPLNEKRSGLNKIGIGVSDINTNAVQSTTSSQTHLKNLPSSTETVTNKMAKNLAETSTQTKKTAGSITETSTQTTSSVPQHVSSEKSSTMTSTEDLVSETTTQSTHYKAQTASVASQTTAETLSREQDMQTASPESECNVIPVPLKISHPPVINPDYMSGVTTVPMDVETSSPADEGALGQRSDVFDKRSCESGSEVYLPSSSITSSPRILAYPLQERRIMPERIGPVLPPRGNVPSTRNTVLNAVVNSSSNRPSASSQSMEKRTLSSSPGDGPARASTSISQNWFNPARPAWSSFGDKSKLPNPGTTSSLSTQTANVETMRNPHYIGTVSTASGSSESKAEHSSAAQNSNEINVGIIGQKPSVSAGKPVSLATPISTTASPLSSFKQSVFPATLSSEDYTRRTNMMTSSTNRPSPTSSLSSLDDEQFINFRASERSSQIHTIGETATSARQRAERVNPSTSSASVGWNISRTQERITPAASFQERITPGASFQEWITPAASASSPQRFERMPEPLLPATSIKTEPSAPAAPTPAEVNPLSNKGDKYSFELADSLKIHICYGDLVSQKVDAIVNSTDGQLTHVNRTSMSVAAAAGNDMINQCKVFLRENGGPLENAQVFNTEASGTLVGKVAHILHVPTPSWIVENETQSCNDLLKTYLNCLNYASNQLKLKSVAFPLVGTDFPADACINAFFKSMLVFVFEKRPDSQLRDISLVIDDFYLAHFCLQMIQSFLEQILLEGIDGVMAEAVNSYYGGSQWERQQNDINQSRLTDRVEEDTVPMTLFRGPAVKRPKL